METRTAYRRGLCVRCQRVAHAAGMPRCLRCHSEVTGYRLTPEQRRQQTVYLMTGTHPHPALYALAVVTAELLSAPAVMAHA